MPHLARVGVALYLATYLVWAGPVTTRLWVGGSHATPEHWAVHTVLNRMGIADHHTEAAMPLPWESADAQPSRPGLSESLLPTVQLAQGVSGLRTSLDSAMLLSSPAPTELDRETWERIVGHDRLPHGQSSNPLERPPAVGI